MKILFEDKNIVICQKGTAELCEISQSKPSLANDVQNAFGYAGVIHRLDMNVGGAVLYAKNKEAASKFNRLVAENALVKEYLAVVHGRPKEDRGTFCDFLFKDSSKNKVFVVKRMRKGVKEASLSYELLETATTDTGELSLVKIKLHTGRSHQIRVQFSSRKMPLAGDGKYGSKDNKCTISLWSHSLSFFHPFSGENISIKSFPNKSAYPWCLFDFMKNE